MLQHTGIKFQVQNKIEGHDVTYLTMQCLNLQVLDVVSNRKST